MNKVIIAITTALIAVTACTQETSNRNIVNPMEEAVRMSTEIIDKGYLIFNNNQFDLKISKDEAIKLGYSDKAYILLTDEIAKKNEAIRIDLEEFDNFSIYADKSNSSNVVEQINLMIINGHITSVDGLHYQINITLDQAIELNYSKESYETAVQRIYDGSIYNVGFILQPSYSSVGLQNKVSNLPTFGGGVLRTTEDTRSETQYYSLVTDLSDILLTISVKFMTVSGSGQHYFSAQTSDEPQVITNGETGRYHYVYVRNEGDYIAIRYATTGTLYGICQFNRIS